MNFFTLGKFWWGDSKSHQQNSGEDTRVQRQHFSKKRQKSLFWPYFCCVGTWGEAEQAQNIDADVQRAQTSRREDHSESEGAAWGAWDDPPQRRGFLGRFADARRQWVTCSASSSRAHGTHWWNESSFSRGTKPTILKQRIYTIIFILLHVF